MPFLTPMATAPGYTVRALSIPDNPYWVALTAGSLLELCNPANWEMSPGGITPYEAAEIAVEIFLSLANLSPEPAMNSKIRVRKLDNTTLTTGVTTRVTYDYQVGDTADYWNALQPDRIIIPAAGWYILQGSVSFAANATGRRTLSLCQYDNSALLDFSAQAGNASGGTVNVLHVFYNGYLNANAPIWMNAFQNSGGNLAMTSGEYGQALSAMRYA